MSLFDMIKSTAEQAAGGELSQLVGKLAGQIPGQSGQAVAGLGSLMDQVGGLQGLKEKFESNGAGEIMNSWLGSGQNLPIDASKLVSVLGPQLLNPIAEKLGLEPAIFHGLLAQILPGAVDQLSKGGGLSLDQLTSFLPKN
jgi:uncharacterized protein YidB (DUF937 family)